MKLTFHFFYLYIYIYTIVKEGEPLAAVDNLKVDPHYDKTYKTIQLYT